MKKTRSDSSSRTHHVRAVVTALLVTVLWSSSWILIKRGLDSIPALAFAGLRYTLACGMLLPFMGMRKYRSELRLLDGRGWLYLLALGVVFYSVTQGAQFLALSYLPAQTTSLFLSFSPVIVAMASVYLIHEKPGPVQVVGIGVYLAGAALFLLPVSRGGANATGYIVAAIGVIANAGASILGRYVNKSLPVKPMTVTVVSMGIGGLLLLISGAAIQGIPALSPRNWIIVFWLAGVNTALAFTMWNVSLKQLSALESSIINGTMLIQIAILAWIFLGERIDGRRLAGLVIAAIGTLSVQLFSKGRR